MIGWEEAPDEWEAIVVAALIDPVPHPDLIDAFAKATGMSRWAALKTTIFGLIVLTAQTYHEAGVADDPDPDQPPALPDLNTSSGPGTAAASRCLRALGAAIAVGPIGGADAALAHLVDINSPEDVTVALQMASSMYRNAVNDPTGENPSRIELRIPTFNRATRRGDKGKSRRRHR